MAEPRPSTPSALEAVLRDLGVQAPAVQACSPEQFAGRMSTECAVVGPLGDPEVQGAALRAQGASALTNSGWAVLWLRGSPPDHELAAWRNQLWPWIHVAAIYRAGAHGLARETLAGAQKIDANASDACTVLVGRRREYVLSPDATIAKFDTNAAGWNSEPGRPGYAHFRWMRKFVARFGEPQAGESVLDFGCGAGWVGIEAGLCTGGAPLAFFDPSPEMVRIAEQNARASGVEHFEGRSGFGERPPFEQRFDHVISSGVVSFSPDHEAWFDGLARTVKPGGKLVVGDLNPASRGMLWRRRTRALLPARELNALEAHAVREQLERRGFRHVRTAGYQCTRPIPQLAHWSDAKLGGALSPLFLAYNRMRAGPTNDLTSFDSWAMSFSSPT